MDLSKAFDTLHHKILLHKLNFYGIRGTELKWFKIYLRKRLQFVEIDGIKSNYQTITTGVPQGSFWISMDFMKCKCLSPNTLFSLSGLFHIKYV